MLCVPEAESLVGSWRRLGDPSATKGVPPHVTLLYPFVPDPDVGVVEELRFFFAGVDGFPLTFRTMGELPDNLHLVPDEADECHHLTASLARRWPECPPYSGDVPVDEVQPHLTVVASPDGDLRAKARAEVTPGLPVRAVIRQAALWVCDDDSRGWTELATFPMGEPDH